MDPLTLFGDTGPTELLGDHGAQAIYVADFLDTDSADAYFTHLNSATRWDRPQIQMYGKTSVLPREVAWIADPGVAYSYSGVSSPPQRWPIHLHDLRVQVEEQSGANFNSVLINRYRDGHDKVAWHAGDEPELGLEPTIASVSLGAERRFQLRHKETRQTVEVRLGHGSLLIMSGTCQRDWIHQVPREARVMESRINLTFRWIHPA